MNSRKVRKKNGFLLLCSLSLAAVFSFQQSAAAAEPSPDKKLS
ncbi:hypothetical protein QKW52_17745 [Bacillus sonorensis]|nr:hypothetical protein [Bacillus sonorensis]